MGVGSHTHGGTPICHTIPARRTRYISRSGWRCQQQSPKCTTTAALLMAKWSVDRRIDSRLCMPCLFSRSAPPERKLAGHKFSGSSALIGILSHLRSTPVPEYSAAQHPAPSAGVGSSYGILPSYSGCRYSKCPTPTCLTVPHAHRQLGNLATSPLPAY